MAPVTTTVTVASTVPIVLGNDDTGMPVKLRVGETRVPEAVWQAWLLSNAHSRLVADGSVRRIERCRQ